MEAIPGSKVQAWLIPSGPFERPCGQTFNKNDIRYKEQLVSSLMTLNHTPKFLMIIAPSNISSEKLHHFLNISFKERDGKTVWSHAFLVSEETNEFGGGASAPKATLKGWGRQGREEREEAMQRWGSGWCSGGKNTGPEGDVAVLHWHF